MWQPDNKSSWILLGAALLIVALWPSTEGRSLAATFVNWAADPGDTLPTLPGPLPPGQSDDLGTVEAHDLQTRMYDELYERGGWTRARLRLKVARDPLTPSAERPLLVGAGVVIAFFMWRFGLRKNS